MLGYNRRLQVSENRGQFGIVIRFDHRRVPPVASIGELHRTWFGIALYRWGRRQIVKQSALLAIAQNQDRHGFSIERTGLDVRRRERLESSDGSRRVDDRSGHRDPVFANLMASGASSK